MVYPFLVAALGSLALAGPASTILGYNATNVEAPQKTLILSAPAGYTPGASQGPIPTPAPANVTHKECTVTPLGWGQDDSSQILAAVKACGTDGTITLPAPYVYTIAKRLYMHLIRSRLNVFGTLSFTPDLGYWINESHRVEFQNQSTAWIVEGYDYIIDGGGFAQGGIDGNGQAWYGYANGTSNRFGRPISIAIANSTNATLQNFSFRQPQFWSIWAQDSHNITLKGIYINGTNTDPHGDGKNFETNVDGLDTLRVDDLIVEDWLFRGGDDCMAPKGNSTNMVFRNLTCIGGGIAFGSVGQYPGAPDYIANVTVSDIFVAQEIRPGYGGATVSGGAYFKSWVGVEAGVPPQGGGGGTGVVSNVTVTNLTVQNTTRAVYVNKCYYKVDSQAAYCDTSTFLFEDLSLSHVRGTVATDVGISLNCSAAAPCRDITFNDVDLRTGRNGSVARVTCVNAEDVVGVVCEDSDV